jgi:hypothetical protein
VLYEIEGAAVDVQEQPKAVQDRWCVDSNNRDKAHALDGGKSNIPRLFRM